MDTTCPQVTCPCSSTSYTWLHRHHRLPVFFLPPPHILSPTFPLLASPPQAYYVYEGSSGLNPESSPLHISLPTCIIPSLPLFQNDDLKRFTYIPDLSYALQILRVKLPSIYLYLEYTDSADNTYLISSKTMSHCPCFLYSLQLVPTCHACAFYCLQIISSPSESY